MQFTLEEMVRASRLSVDTIRYDQTRGLLHSPRRQRRRTSYDDSHLSRLHMIRSARAGGLPLRMIGKLVAKADGLTSDADFARGEQKGRAAALKLLRHGFPIPKLFALGIRHDTATWRTVEEAIELFDEYVQ